MNQSELKKGLGLVHVFTIASGAMIGSGLFVLPGMAHAMAGPGVVWSYVLAGLLAGAGALSMAELVTAMPKAGSNYFYIMRGFGPEAGSIAGILSWFSIALKSSFAIVGMATFVRLVVDIHGLAAGAVLTLGFVVLNIVGVREAARAQAVIAQVVQEPDFEARWSAARGTQGLRDVIVLSKRRRSRTRNGEDCAPT